MIYECVFLSFDLIWFLVAVLIVPGGFERGCLLIVAWFLPPWAELVDPSAVFVEKRGGRLGDLPPRPAPRPSFGAFGQKVEIFDRSPLPAPFGMTVPFCSLVGVPGAVFLDGRGLVSSSSELSSRIGLLILAVFISIPASFEAAAYLPDQPPVLALGIVGRTQYSRLWFHLFVLE